MAARRFTITGRVQGVYFRESTRRVAEPLGLAGHAINLANGDVEVLAVGEADRIDELAAWLETGPPLARVDSVDIKEVAIEEPPAGFMTG